MRVTLAFTDNELVQSHLSLKLYHREPNLIDGQVRVVSIHQNNTGHISTVEERMQCNNRAEHTTWHIINDDVFQISHCAQVVAMTHN